MRVSGTTKALLAYVWPVGDDGDAVAGPDVLAALLQPAITSMVSALRQAATASRERAPDTAGLNIESENRLMSPPQARAKELTVRRRATQVNTSLPPMDDHNVRPQFRAITEAAGRGKAWVPRELRHTFVSLLAAHGVPVEAIMLLAGHNQTVTTELVYRAWKQAGGWL